MARPKFGPPILPLDSDDAKEPELTVARVGRSLQEDPRIPANPTDGWMLHELDLLGASMRGKSFDGKVLARMLRERGYDVTGQGRKKPTDTDKDR